jgi:hypothetical protein
MRLHFYTTSPSAIADGALFDLVSADRANYIDYTDLGTPAKFGSTLFASANACGIQARFATGSTSLFALLETRNGFTPGAVSEVYDLRVNSVEVSL